jgi:hypothetical protein
MKLVRFMLPKFDNEGNPLNHETNLAVDTIVRNYGGCTIYREGIVGLWVDGADRRYEDHHAVVEVVIPEPVDMVALRAVKEVIRLMTRQIELFVTIQEVDLV